MKPFIQSARRNVIRLAFAVPVVGAMFAMPASAIAEDYPNKPIKLVVPYATGGSTDATGRLIAKSLSDRLNQPVVVENRAGAGGSIGNDAVAKAAPDGYTLLFSAAGPLTVTPHTYSNLNYKPIDDFQPITLVATQPLLLVVNPNFKVDSVADVIKVAKERPGELNYGSFGTGSAAHLAGELFKSRTGVSMEHVPYKGSGPALIDLVGGQIDLLFDVFSTAAPLVKGEKLKAIAITADNRSPQFPNVPTMKEAGVENFDAGTWFGVLAPAGTPRHIVDKLSEVLNEALQEKELRETLEAQGAVVRGGTPEEFGTFFRSEFDKWGALVRAAGITVQ